MGSINKDPKTPAQTPSASPFVTSQVSEPSEPTKTDSALTAESRTESLLRRSRGRFGTILSGFTGFLNSKSDTEKQSRKTLLGE